MAPLGVLLYIPFREPPTDLAGLSVVSVEAHHAVAKSRMEMPPIHRAIWQSANGPKTEQGHSFLGVKATFNLLGIYFINEHIFSSVPVLQKKELWFFLWSSLWGRSSFTFDSAVHPAFALLDVAFTDLQCSQKHCQTFKSNQIQLCQIPLTYL